MRLPLTPDGDAHSCEAGEQGMERELARLRAVAHSIIIEKQPEPPGWDWDDYKRR